MGDLQQVEEPTVDVEENNPEVVDVAVEATVMSPKSSYPEGPATLGDWLESCVHRYFTCQADDIYGDGYITRDQRIALSAGIGSALDNFHTTVLKAFPEAYSEPVPQDEADEDESDESAKTGDDVPTEDVTEAKKTEDGKDFPSSDYAYVPDAAKPSTWKLRLSATPGGGPDTGIVGAAAAALGAGFRGNKVEIPEADLSRVKAKVRSAWHRANPGKSADDMPDSLHEVDYFSFDSDEIPLAEASVGNDGSGAIKIIAPGWGSSGYYSAEVLRRDGPKIFPAGTHMYLDHPSRAEERDRPERSIKDLAAVTTETPWYDPSGPKGEGLYTHVNVLSNHRGMIEELAPHIGVSIRGAGVGGTGTVEGRKGRVFERLTRGDSIDFVTHAGAGGAVLSEAATPIVGTPLLEDERVVDNQADSLVEEPLLESKEEIMDDQNTTVAAVEEKVAAPAPAAKSAENVDVVAVYEDVARLREAQVILQAELAKERGYRLVRDAEDTVTRELNATKLPAPVKNRLQSSLSGNPPLRSDGSLDTEAFVETIRETAKKEAEYIASILGSSPVRGMSSLTPTSIAEASAEQSATLIAEELKFMGISEKSARDAATGGLSR